MKTVRGSELEKVFHLKNVSFGFDSKTFYLQEGYNAFVPCTIEKLLQVVAESNVYFEFFYALRDERKIWDVLFNWRGVTEEAELLRIILLKQGLTSSDIVDWGRFLVDCGLNLDEVQTVIEEKLQSWLEEEGIPQKARLAVGIRVEWRGDAYSPGGSGEILIVVEQARKKKPCPHLIEEE